MKVKVTGHANAVSSTSIEGSFLLVLSSEFKVIVNSHKNGRHTHILPGCELHLHRNLNALVSTNTLLLFRSRISAVIL